MESSRGVRSLERTPLNAFLFYAVLNSDFHILQGYQGRSPCLVRVAQALACCVGNEIRAELFVPQGYDGIDTGSAARGDVARCKRDDCKHRGGHANAYRIARLHVVKQAGHQASERERGD